MELLVGASEVGFLQGLALHAASAAALPSHCPPQWPALAWAEGSWCWGQTQLIARHKSMGTSRP